MTGLVVQVAFYHRTMLEFTELLRVTHSACLGACFYTPVAMEVIKMPDFNYLDLDWV